ncbi:MAG: hypothetical protein H7122_20685 [Chitinophagaceae bacterium]|nr:hypothetical protein [Chitinophagaceae bacterium]
MKKALTIITILFIMIACSKTTADSSGLPDCSVVARSFAADVNPIIQSSCATNSGCHGSGSNNGPGELIRHSQIFSARSAIRAAVISGRMPKNGSLTTAQKNSISCWIDNAAPNN